MRPHPFVPAARTRARVLAALTAAALASATLAGVVPASAADGPPASPRAAPTAPREVMFVGNNWAGTASIVDAHTLEVLRRGIDLVPDKQQELREIFLDPVRLLFYLAIQQGPGQGHNQYVDDMFSTRDGRYLAVSRPSFADVVWVDIAAALAGAPAGEVIVHEEPMDGFRSDHMALSPDGRRLLVSDSTERQVIEFSMVDETLPDGTEVTMGERLRTFESGETPHESNYSQDGSRIFHASIGKVYTPGDHERLGPIDLGPIHDPLKGDRWFQVVRNEDFTVSRRWDIGEELAEAGHPGMSSAVRPMAIAPDERFVYFQVSWFHGLVEFDLTADDVDPASSYTSGGLPEPDTGAVRRVVPLPNRVPDLPRALYVNDSAHHGLAMDEDGETLCVAGTMDDYVAMVDRETMSYAILDHTSGPVPAGTDGRYGKPYWSTEGPGDTCWVSLSASDAVAVLDFESGEELAYLAVGDHPQRVRHGYVAAGLLD